MSEPMQKDRFIILDGCRGFAAFGVMAFHIWLHDPVYSGINTFVDFFFVLSGFVLAPNLIENRKGINTKFIAQRILRLWPPLVPVFIWIIAKQRIPQLHKFSEVEMSSWVTYLGAFLLLQIFMSNLIHLNGPLWSLSAEFFVNLFAACFAINRKKCLVFFGLGVILEIVGLQINSHFNLNWGVQSYSIAFGRSLAGFSLGILTRISHSKKNEPNKSKLAKGLVLVLILLWTYQFSNFTLIFAAPIYALLIQELANRDQILQSKLIKAFFLFLGRISFGVYVWHGVIGHHSASNLIFARYGIQVEAFARSSLSVVCIILQTLVVVEINRRFIEPIIRNILMRSIENVKRFTK